MLVVSDAHATHLVGSDMYYVDLGGGNYNVILKVYTNPKPIIKFPKTMAIAERTI